jgi:hypothetical protein
MASLKAADERVRAMEWARPEHSRSQVNKAGRVLVDPQVDYIALMLARNIVNNWRSSHNYPLNTFKVTLRQKALEVDPPSLRKVPNR